MSKVRSLFIGRSSLALTLLLLLLLSLFPGLRCENSGGLMPSRLTATVDDSSSSDGDGKFRFRSGARSAWSWSSRQVKQLPLRRIQSIPEYVKNYGYGSQIEDHKNMPIYMTHATIASFSLTMLSKWWDPTYTIAAINALIWLGWQMADEDHLLLRFMTDNFLLHKDPSKNFKPRQVLLCGFSQISDAHLTSNLGCLLPIGPLVRRYTNWSAFSYTSFYIASLYASSLFNAVVYTPLMKTYGPKSKESFFSRFLPKQSASLGASGAVSAVITFCGLTCPNEQIRFEEDQSSDASRAEPMWIIALSAFLSDIILPLTEEGKHSNVGHGAHIGGSIFGATVFVINRLWGARLRKLVIKSNSFVKKLIPKPIRNICRRVRQHCCKVKACLGRILRGVYARICALPWMEMFGFVVTAIALAMDGDEANELE